MCAPFMPVLDQRVPCSVNLQSADRYLVQYAGEERAIDLNLIVGCCSDYAAYLQPLELRTAVPNAVRFFGLWNQ